MFPKLDMDNEFEFEYYIRQASLMYFTLFLQYMKNIEEILKLLEIVSCNLSFLFFFLDSIITIFKTSK